jgi:hypothetical protein
MNVNALAKTVGTSAAMIEKHCGKFIRGDVRDMRRRGMSAQRAWCIGSGRDCADTL